MGNTQSEIADDDDPGREQARRPDKRQRTGSSGTRESKRQTAKAKVAVRAKSLKSSKSKLAQDRQDWRNQRNAGAYSDGSSYSSEASSDNSSPKDTAKVLKQVDTSSYSSEASSNNSSPKDTAKVLKQVDSSSLDNADPADRRDAIPSTQDSRDISSSHQLPPTKTQSRTISGGDPATVIGKRKRPVEHRGDLVYLAGNRTKSRGFPSAGQVSSDELKAIGSAASFFMQENGLVKDELYELIQENPQKSTMHSAFWATIFESLPNRANSEGRIPTTQRGNIIKVVRRTMNKYAAFGNKWDAEMDQLLWSTVQEDMAKEGHPKWQSYQEMFQRYHEHIRDHYRWIQKSSMGAWTAAEETKFLELITDAVAKLKAASKPTSRAGKTTESRPSGNFPDEIFDFESQINFKTIAEQMSTRNDLQCRNKFRIMKANRMKDRLFEQTKAALKYEGGSTREMQAIDHYKRMKTGDIYSILKDVHLHLTAKKATMECDIRWLDVHKHATVGTWMLLDRKIAFQQTIEDMVPEHVAHQTNTLSTLEQIMRYFRKKKTKELGDFYDVATHGPLPRTWYSNKCLDKAKSAATVVESSSESSADESSSSDQNSPSTKMSSSVERSSMATGRSASGPLAERSSTESSSATSSSADSSSADSSSADDNSDDSSSDGSSDSSSSDGDSSSDES